jgi:hypothetical protein
MLDIIGKIKGGGIRIYIKTNTSRFATFTFFILTHRYIDT